MPVPDSVDLSISNSTANLGDIASVEINASNDDSIAGFQFTLSLSDDLGSVVSLEPTARTQGFNVSTNNGIVIGFSLTGDVIAPGNGPIVIANIQTTSPGETDVCLTNAILSDPEGLAMPYESTCGGLVVTEGPVEGCTDSNSCNFNPQATLDDGSCEYESCAGCLDEEALNYDPEATIDDGSCLYNDPVHFVVNLNETGESSLIIIENALDLEYGDEVGLFDSQGVVESCDPASGCEDVIIGEVLVGSGVWTGEQLNIVGIGSVYLSEFGGPVLNGYSSGNNIVYKVWKSSTNMEYLSLIHISEPTRPY